MQKLQQAAVSIINGGCLCKHPTLGRGGTCPNCHKKLPALADKFHSMRSRSGGVGFGEAPSLVQPSRQGRDPKLGFVSNAFQESSKRPNTVDGSSSRGQRGQREQRPSMIEVGNKQMDNGDPNCNSISNPVSPGCSYCAALQAALQAEKESTAELKTSIDRLNAQVSYHIFSNTQLQKELDKARGKHKHNDEQKEISRLKAELADMEKKRNELQNVVVPEPAAKEDALKRAQMNLRSVKKELREAQEARQRAAEDGDQAALRWKKSYEAEQGKNSRLQKELDDANKMLDSLRNEMNNGSKQKEDKSEALQKQLSQVTKELLAAQDQLKSSQDQLLAADCETKQVKLQLAALQQQQAESNNAAGGVELELRSQIAALQQQIAALQKQIAELQAANEASTNEIAQLEKQVQEAAAAAEKSAAQLKQTEQEKVQLGAQGARWKKEGDELRAELAALRKQQQSAGDEKLNGLQKQLEVVVAENEELKDGSEMLKAKIAALEKEIAELKAGKKGLEQQVLDEQQRCKQAVSDADDAKKQLSRLLEDLNQSKSQLGDAVQQLNGTSKRLRECEEKSVSNIKKLKSSEQEQLQLNKDKKRLERELKDCDATKSAMLDKAQKALERLKSQVLQMTCQGLLRLCVVAPRVTIAFEMKNINVSALLPSLEIHDMLEKELLPKYTKVFLQPGENLGPEGEEMEKWLQGLLKDMETKIEQKLVSVLNENVPQGSVVASNGTSNKKR